MAIQSQFHFTLPIGYQDTDGQLHRDGVMRLATAMDEIAPLRDPRVRDNQAYLVIILLARTVMRLGSLSPVSTDIIEKLYSADLTYLQEFYTQINEQGHNRWVLSCPHCAGEFELDLSSLGES